MARALAASTTARGDLPPIETGDEEVQSVRAEEDLLACHETGYTENAALIGSFAVGGDLVGNGRKS